MSKARFAALAEIPLGTFKHYVHDDPTKRYKLGCGVGESGKKLLDEDAAQFVVDTIRRMDRADDGMTRRESIDMIQDLRPELSQKQAMSQFDRNVRPQNKQYLTGVIKAEATTTKRSAITVPQQYRWHKVHRMPTLSALTPPPALLLPTLLPGPRLPVSVHPLLLRLRTHPRLAIAIGVESMPYGSRPARARRPSTPLSISSARRTPAPPLTARHSAR